MSAPTEYQLVGRWRIVEADIWDRDYIDLCRPATLAIGADNCGEIGLGAMQADLYSSAMAFFTWTGSDEMNEVSGEGRQNCCQTAPSLITTATKPSSPPSGGLL